MRILLDTHAFLWYLLADPRLGGSAQSCIADLRNQLFLSKASLWEIVIKVSIGKLTLPAPFAQVIPSKIQQMGLALLEIQLDDLDRLSQLPFHHKDPFDRLLAAQCLVAGLPILSADSDFDAYGLQRLW